jgi:amino acid permease
MRKPSFHVTQMKPLKKGENAPGEEKISVFGAFSAYLSCIMGAGICSIPFSFVNVGPLAGVIIHAIIIFLILICVLLLLKSKDHLGYE